MSAPGDAVEAALAHALYRAAEAGRFDVVAQLAREPEARRLFHLLLFEELKLLEPIAERDGPNAPDSLRKLIRMVPSTNSPTVAQVTRLGRRSEA